ncbi:hypothetical protein PUMCH_004458 [Australozyma saopauloensis]|uniref:Formate/nitrite transporter n=1 Tax=Australozyma saopauloensis TaxID=291208 RepID=A0AAX4HEY2_9ASCO|nr:hypothetical protein PUMCH_004458 [[Candida] saopauloensis]
MVDESLYLTTHEAALAVVATAMKKARQLMLTLAVNSLMGGIFFSSGGMLHVMLQAELTGLSSVDPGILFLLQGLVYPIGLFYVVLMGVDLFNSNILFFTVGVVRGAVSILDLVISWMVSWWLNLVGNIFVCYIICHYSGVTSTEAWVAGSISILERKLELSFVETLIKGMAGNFYVCLAIYLQLMAKPIHVKMIAMTLPIFTFVSLGFTHSVADMFMIIIGLINGAPVSVGTCAWKLFLPGALGNMIGGSFFALVVPWYLHLVVVERDQKKLNLPRYEMRDEQPELNQDSRVVRVPEQDQELEDIDDILSDENEKLLRDNAQMRPISHVTTSASMRSGASVRSRMRKTKSPGNVFPVYGMGESGARERAVAYGVEAGEDDALGPIDGPPNHRRASFIGSRLWRTLSRKSENPDLEAQEDSAQANETASINLGSMSQKLRSYSLGKIRRANTTFGPSEIAPDAVSGQRNFDQSESSIPNTLLSNLTAAAIMLKGTDIQPYEPEKRD